MAAGRRPLTLDIQPSVAAGSIRLGMPLGAAVALLQTHGHVIKRVDFVYEEKDPLASDWRLILAHEGIVLSFEPRTQRLRLIELKSFGRLTLKYQTQPFSTPSSPCDLLKVYRAFGPTYPGTYEAANNTYTLKYPGAEFEFSIPPDYATWFISGAQQQPTNGDPVYPLTFHDESSPAATAVLLFDREGTSESPTLPPLPVPSGYWEEVQGVIGYGITLPITTGATPVTVLFGDTAQDVTMALGPPDDIFYKTSGTDRLRAHKGNLEGGSPHAVDYFYNYFKRGFDVVFDGCTHVVKKIILHTNFPAHGNFNIYAKCNFSVPLRKPKPDPGEGDGDDGPEPWCPAPFQAINKPRASASSEEFVLSPDSWWSEVQGWLGPCGDPLVNNPSSGPSTMYYAYTMGVVLEVVTNGSLASVTLFQPTPP